uniref:Uncharacterized protein n=1 Tax=Rhizophora mucronata TaxID=61149 RepID=A0A2P2QQ61_RHIMU
MLIQVSILHPLLQVLHLDLYENLPAFVPNKPISVNKSPFIT